jgi:hypothetical protein
MRRSMAQRRFAIGTSTASRANSTRKEAERKRECVDAENERRLERGEPPIGYISFVRGSIISQEAFQAALSGKTLPLIERSTEGVLVN